MKAHGDIAYARVLQGAAHELGHAIVDLAGGLRVRSVVFDPANGAGMTEVEVHLEDDTEPAVWRAWLIGCVAGFESETQWCARYGGRAHRQNSKVDFANFHEHRRRVRLSEGAARAAARKILRQHWRDIERLAPQLVSAGQMTTLIGGFR